MLPQPGSLTKLYWNITVELIDSNLGSGKHQLCSATCDVPSTYNTIYVSRPSTIHERIPPSELSSHRNSHRMLGPCCLCPMADQYAPDFVESAIYRKTDDPYSGEWVATCARNKCGYIGYLTWILMRRMQNTNL